MVRIIKTLDELGFDLATFMWHLSWSSTATTRDETIKYARTAFLHCDEFPLMLRKCETVVQLRVRKVRWFSPHQ